MITVKKIISNLAFQVLLAILLGVGIGHFFPATGIRMEILGKSFVEILKIFIAPIIFLTITLGIGSIGDLKKVGRVGIKALVYFEVITTCALAIGIGTALLFKPGQITKDGLSIQDVSKFTQQADHPFDWLQFFQSNTTLQILALAIISGIILSYSKKREKIVLILNKVAGLVYKLLRYVMYLAPIGAFGGIAFAVGKFGLHSLVPLGKLMLCVYLTMAIFIFVVLGSILHYYKISIWKYLQNIKEEILIVLATSSSEAALPPLINKLEKMGCSKSVVGLVVPNRLFF